LGGGSAFLISFVGLAIKVPVTPFAFLFVKDTTPKCSLGAKDVVGLGR
jgi:hypothetical protein